jgi:hypothetical protein
MKRKNEMIQESKQKEKVIWGKKEGQLEVDTVSHSKRLRGRESRRGLPQRSGS